MVVRVLVWATYSKTFKLLGIILLKFLRSNIGHNEEFITMDFKVV